MPATVAFGIVACNPLLAMLIDVFVRRSFDAAPRRARLLLSASMTAYAVAICVLAGFT